MQFGKAYGTTTEEETTGTSDYLRYFKNDTTTFRVLQEPNEWIEYWEHFNPGGYPFPCTGDRKSCPGCISNNEKMKKASKKVAVQVLEGEWVNAYKLPKTVADKLANRAQRLGSVTDRDYTIFKVQSKNADGSIKTDYDIEGQDKIPVNVKELEPKFRDIQAILTKMFEEAWGNPDKAMETERKAEESQAESSLKDKIKRSEENEQQPPWEKDAPAPVDSKVWTEEELRGLSVDAITKVCQDEGVGAPPEDLKTTDQIVDWLLDQ